MRNNNIHRVKEKYGIYKMLETMTDKEIGMYLRLCMTQKELKQLMLDSIKDML